MEIKLSQIIEDATRVGRKGLYQVGIALLFIIAVMLFISGVRGDGAPLSIELVLAAIISQMMAALLARALCLNVATYIGAPVSTTHSM